MSAQAARRVAAALTSKGFVERDVHHKRYHFIYQGRDVGVSTKISHGADSIGPALISQMRKQMRLASNADFADFVECSLSRDDYVAILKSQGVIPN